MKDRGGTSFVLDFKKKKKKKSQGGRPEETDLEEIARELDIRRSGGGWEWGDAGASGELVGEGRPRGVKFDPDPGPPRELRPVRGARRRVLPDLTRRG